MKYQVFTYRERQGVARPGVLIQARLYDLRGVMGEAHPEWRCVDDLLADWSDAHPFLRELAGDVSEKPELANDALLVMDDIEFLPPLTRCGVIYAAGANYRDHVEAMGKAMNMKLNLDPKADGLPPWHFIKAGQAALSGHKEHVAFPAHSKMLDWEAELAVVIGRKASNVSVESALDYVAGYSCANDMSARDNLKRDQVDVSSPFRFDWIGHKCFKGACPLGPYLTPAEFAGDPENLGIKLWLNDELRQNSSTSNHLYTVADQIAYLSARLDLLPGDILLTGTPAGVGMESGVFLKRGDVMRVWIESLGELETRLV
ncbi:fumarylacetoacetate hydrolase family protein [Neopusillimonas maritima]|uniref:2-keto-4-pentenoate hydratase n=1 Tax=Neopusillimonas maritima TaxID=2026239 RepID=A0A3A1YZQ5_9BURK|nr:fumarylacetoacetate hydrolase family protein [Neopusillimonas maritima]RIY42280.1 2-keto-4-pentenoate hydratase [Neopusillimonas maritima]